MGARQSTELPLQSFHSQMSRRVPAIEPMTIPATPPPEMVPEQSLLLLPEDWRASRVVGASNENEFRWQFHGNSTWLRDHPPTHHGWFDSRWWTTRWSLVVGAFSGNYQDLYRCKTETRECLFIALWIWFPALTSRAHPATIPRKYWSSRTWKRWKAAMLKSPFASTGSCGWPCHSWSHPRRC